jgi:intracellular sulfur oxidation DsrE/DsrF family protein
MSETEFDQQVQTETDSSHKARVVFHVNFADDGQFNDTLRTMRNLLKESPDAEVELVCQGRGVDFVREPTTRFAPQLGELNQKGVKIVACRNSLAVRDIPPSELIGFVEIVPSAIGELIRCQQDGMAYYKP